jgi:hypothetical protein
VVDPLAAGAPGPASVAPGRSAYLAFCGGGKDSLVSARLLEHAGVGYDAFVYASSAYGDLASQHRLVDRLLEHLRPGAVRRASIFDDFLGSPVLELGADRGIRTVAAAETPSSLFEALPLVLEHGYRYLVLGHEKSADTGSLVWDVTGEEINHQWGKSTAAEGLLAAYIRDHLVAGCSFFSILKPIHDVTIFELLADEPFEAVASTHSCNVAKPWCRRCPKCVYVWLNYLAYLPADAVAAMFGEDLFAVAANERDLRMLAGVEAHPPFECVGHVGETRLALERCRAKGLTGPLLEAIPVLAPDERAQAVDRFTRVDEGYRGLPGELRGPVLARQRQAAARAGVALRALG